MLLPVIKQCESAICTYPLPLEFCPIPNSIYLGYHKMEKTMAPHSSTLAWKISWTEEPGRLWSHGVTKSWTRLSDFTFAFHFHALEKEMATHSSALAWRILGTGEPGGQLSMGLHRVGHDWSNLAAAAGYHKTPNWASCAICKLAIYFTLGIIHLSVPVSVFIPTSLLHSVCMPIVYIWIYSCPVSQVKNLPTDARDMRDMGSIPGSGRCP